MVRPGPLPTPSKTLEKRGSWRHDLNPNEPRPDPQKPRRPQYLSKLAKIVWDQLAPQLHKMGVLTKVDREALAKYCTTWANWRRCQAHVDEHGFSFPVYGPSPGQYPDGHEKAGEPIPGQIVKYVSYPEGRALRGLVDQLTKLEDRFGMNPSVRTRIVAHPPCLEEEPEPAPPSSDEEGGESGGKVLGVGRFFGGGSKKKK